MYKRSLRNDLEKGSSTEPKLQSSRAQRPTAPSSIYTPEPDKSWGSIVSKYTVKVCDICTYVILEIHRSLVRSEPSLRTMESIKVRSAVEREERRTSCMKY